MKKRSLILFISLLSSAVFLAAEDAAPPAASTAPAVTAVEAPAALVTPPENSADLRRQAEALMAKDKKSPQPYLLLARACFIEKRYGKTLSSCEKALKWDPHCADAYYWRGRAFEEENKLDEAANEYQAALKAAPDHAQAQVAWKKLSDRLTAADAK